MTSFKLSLTFSVQSYVSKQSGFSKWVLYCVAQNVCQKPIAYFTVFWKL